MYPFSRDQLSVVFLVVVSTLKLAGTVIVTAPKDVDAVLGTSVIFNCSTSLPQTDVQWVHYPIEKDMQVIYAYGKINAGYAHRFTVQNGHNLHISSITVDDAGTFECQDDYGRGERRSAELIVLESNPMCQSSNNLNKVVGNNTCGIEPGQLTLTCSVRYQGKKAPSLEWRESDGNSSLPSRVGGEIGGNAVVHNFTVDGDSVVNGSSYNCRPGKAASTTTSCNSGAIVVIGKFPVTTVDASKCQCESCQINMYAMISITIVGIVITILVNAFVAGVVWHLFIDVQIQSSNEGPNANESTNLLNKEREAIELKSNTESSARVKTSSSDVAQQKSTKAGSKSKGMFSTDAKIFVSAMAVPLCIGLLLWYLIAYRQAKRKKKKGQGGNGQLATFLNQQHKMEEMQENINNLESAGKNKQQTIEGLKGELEEARSNLTKDAANAEELEKLLAESERNLKDAQRKLDDAQKMLDDAQKKWDVERKALNDENKLLWNQLNDLKKNPKAEKKYNVTNVQAKIQIETSKFPQKPIKSFALLDNELYIFYQNEVEADVVIFDATEWKQKRRLKLKDVTNPEDAVACVQKRCIYVSEGDRIFRVKADMKHLNDWQTGSAEIRMSVSRDSTVIVTMRDKRKIKEFSSKGIMLGEFDLQKVDMPNPVHAIKIRKDVFIVINGKPNDAIGLHRVCEVSFPSYQILKSFGSNQGRGNTQLSNPKHLAIDHNGSIFVADAGNARIVVLGSNLAFKRQEFSEKDPTTVVLDEINSRLYI